MQASIRIIGRLCIRPAHLFSIFSNAIAMRINKPVIPNTAETGENP
jgi:hypothetical protein